MVSPVSAKISNALYAMFSRFARNVTDVKDGKRIDWHSFASECAFAGKAMHIPARVFVVVSCAIFSAQLQAADLVSVVEENFPYEEVDQSHAMASIQQSRCLEGTPFEIVERRWETSTNMDIAERIHATLNSLGANAFVITDIEEDARVSRVVVTPLTCDAG